jgi:catechol 2,3-dioxygenase-like lactoylglutathione lyase family enzyme
MSGSIRFSGVGVDSADAGKLAAFYAEITGGRIVTVSAEWASIDGPGGRIDFWTVPDYAAPTWPAGTTPKQMHIDFLVDDLEAAQARVLAAGATKYDVQPNAGHCYVFADPAGHPFCLSLWGAAATWEREEDHTA